MTGSSDTAESGSEPGVTAYVDAVTTTAPTVTVEHYDPTHHEVLVHLAEDLVLAGPPYYDGHLAAAEAERVRKALAPLGEVTAEKREHLRTIDDALRVCAEFDRRGTEIEQLRAENERLLDAAAKTLANRAKLKGMSVEDGAALLELDSPREIVIAWVWAARQMLGDAPNYSETRIDFPTASASMEVKAAGEVERYVFTVQRAGKVTPHEARRAAEADNERLCEQNDNLRMALVRATGRSFESIEEEFGS